jgi:hypothetical protein
MTGVNCGGQNRIVPRVPGRGIPRQHNGPDSSLFLQPAGPLAIVQTYSAVQAVPKGSTFEQYQQDRTSEAEIEMQIVAVCYELCP